MGVFTALTVLVALLAGLVYFLLIRCPYTFQTPEQLNPKYDYIIVGGGSAGSILAARLSEQPDVSVLVLEAGPHPYTFPLAYIPLISWGMKGTSFDWSYQTVPQSHCCLGLNNQKAQLPAGKMLGGSSSMNGLAWVRSHPEDFKRWKELGNPGWGADDMMPWYEKVENVLTNSLRRPGRGTKGPIAITESDYDPIADLFLKAFNQLGYPILDDYNIDKRFGFGWSQFLTDGRTRFGSARAYLNGALGRPNLHVVTEATVHKVLFSDNHQAVGVEYYHGGKTHRVSTNREIIVSAGALGSPRILLHSGIGPRDDLAKLKIPLVKDLPGVGSNLQDHITADLTFAFNQSIGPSIQDLTSPLGYAKGFIQWALGGGGHLVYPAWRVQGFLKTDHSHGRPDLQINVNTVPLAYKVQDYWDITNEIVEVWGKNAQYPSAATVLAILLHPKSIGRLSLKSADPFEPSLIDINYLARNEDRETLKAGLKISLKLASTKAISEFGGKVVGKIPGCDHLEWLSDDYLDCLIRHDTLTVFHQTGTCSMGPNATNHVVDTNLRVYGTSGLRVVDASVFPATLSANTFATVATVAEKAADMIKSSHA